MDDGTLGFKVCFSLSSFLCFSADVAWVLLAVGPVQLHGNDEKGWAKSTSS